MSVAWPSGLRRWFKAPVSSEAWVRIPPLPSSFCSFPFLSTLFSSSLSIFCIFSLKIENKIHINIEIEKWRNRFKCPFYWPRYASPTKTVFSTVKSPTDAAGNYSNISELLILKIKLRMFDT